MKTFESKSYSDVDGDTLQIDCHDTHVEILVYSQFGCFPCDNPATLRAMAEQLVRGAEELERQANS